MASTTKIIFQMFATREMEGEQVGTYVLDSYQLENAFNALGMTLSDTDPNIKQTLIKSPKIPYEKFQAAADKALRWHMISSIIMETFTNDLIDKFIPEKTEDVLKLDRPKITSILSEQDFISAATEKLFASLQRRKMCAIHAFVPPKHCLIDEMWSDSLVLGRGPRRPQRVKDDTPARSVTCFVPEKFKSHGRFLRDCSSLPTLSLEEELGPADGSILRAILREHMVGEDSDEPFVSSTYGILTTPLLELARLLGDDDKHGNKSAWSYFRENSSHPDANNGPTHTEVERLHQEFHVLREAFAATSGRFPGEAGDSYAESLLDVSVTCEDDEAAAVLAERFADSLGAMAEEWVQGLTLAEQSARGLAVVAAPAARGAAVTATFALPHAEPGAAAEDMLGRLKRGLHAALDVDEGRIRADHCGSRTYVYSEHTNASALRAALLSSERTAEQLAEAAAAAVPASARRRERGRTREESADVLAQAFAQETEAWRKERRFRKQARRRLRLSQIMALPEVAAAGLRVEEALVLHLFTGPMFQVREPAPDRARHCRPPARTRRPRPDAPGAGS